MPVLARGQFTCKTNADHTITITRYTGSGSRVLIPDTINDLPVTGIGPEAFEDTGLTWISLPGGLTTIGDQAFTFNMLTNIWIPASVTTIGERAFSMNELTGVMIPDGVTNIGGGPFMGCTRLTDISVGAANPSYCSVQGVLYSKDQSTLIEFPAGSFLPTYTIVSNATSIADWAFDGCGLRGITLPTGVTNLGNYSFGGCGRLGGLVLPPGITTIGHHAFEYCSSLTNIVIPAAVTNIGTNAFDSCSNLNAITVAAANASYASANGVLFSKAWTSLIRCPPGRPGSFAFPDGVITVEPVAFSGCAGLTAVTFGSGVRTIGDNAFFGCALLTAAALPNSVTNIGASAFRYCGLTSFTFPNTLASIKEYSFDGDSNLLGVVIPDTVTDIGVDAFAGCGLTNVTIPNGVFIIDYGAFYGCGNLTNATIGEGVTYIRPGAFGACGSLTAIVVAPDNLSYSSFDGILFDQSKTMLLQFPAGRAGTYIVPDGVWGIGEGAFEGCAGLTNVDLPSSVLDLGQLAFSDCSNLTAVYFQGDAPYISGDNVLPYQGVFDDDTNVFVYYLPGTTGWGTDFGGRPTVPWLPRMETSGPGNVTGTGAFSFTVNWASGRSVVVEACTNLANPAWYPLATNTIAGGSFCFSDPDRRSYGNRFYRVRTP
jgi:hypothetical protein